MAIELTVITFERLWTAIVLGSEVTAYGPLTALAGSSDRFVARFVDRAGHCNFTPAQIGGAFDALRAWAREGQRPLPESRSSDSDAR